MSSSESEPSAVAESDADRIRQNDESLTDIIINKDVDIAEILDALKNNTVVKEVYFYPEYSVQLNQEALDKLSEVMKCNKSVESLQIYLRGGLLRERFFATMATSGGWSSIQELYVLGHVLDGTSLSLREAEHVSTFIFQSENLHTLSLPMCTMMRGDDLVSIVETLVVRTNTKVQSLEILFDDYAFSLQNGGRQIANALRRCTFTTDLQLHFEDEVELEFFQILLVESIPKMLGLKKFELAIYPFDGRIFDMAGQCIELHQGEIEELTLEAQRSRPSVNTSIVGLGRLAPALKRLKAIGFHGFNLTSQQIGELSGIAAGCDTLEEFVCNLNRREGMPTEDYKAICQVLSTFPSLKRVTLQPGWPSRPCRRLTAFLEMVKTSKTIEEVQEVPSFLYGRAAIKYHCRNNMMHNRIREKGLLSANVPGSAWPLFLAEFSDMPDVLYYLLHEKNGAMIGPTRHG